MIAGLVLVALVVTAYVARGLGPRGGYLLIAVSVVWLVADKGMEGVHVVHLTQDHGLVAADLAGLAGLALGAWQVWPDLTRRLRRSAGRRK